MLIQILAACTAEPVVNNYYEYNTYTQAAPTDTGTVDDDSAKIDSATTDAAPDTSSDDTATDTAAEEPSLADRVCASSILNEFTNPIDDRAEDWFVGHADYLYCYGGGQEPYVGPDESGMHAAYYCDWVTDIYNTPCPDSGCLRFYSALNYKSEFVLSISAERITFDLCDVRTDTLEIAGYRVVDGTTEFSQLTSIVSPGEGICGTVSVDFEEPVTQLSLFENSPDTDYYGIDNLLFEWDCEKRAPPP